jgi:hypothetical protein
VSNLGREMADIVAAVRATKGWRVVDGTHYQAFAPDGKTIVTISKTPGSQTRIKAYKAQLGKLGVTFKKGTKRKP